MPLSLNAEQKNIKNIFLNEEQFIIPSYQRPYSWEYDQCLQLYTDLMTAFDEKTEYFIGNIIIANSDDTKGHFYLVDGQQRIITIWLLLKVLYILFPEMNILKRMLEIISWEGNTNSCKIKSEIFEAKDNDNLEEIFNYQRADFDLRLMDVSDKQNRINERKCKNRIEANALFFYYWLKSFVSKAEKNQGKEYIHFLLENVSLLPIQLMGKTMDEANNKALMIFETINNRGMNLEDADIFKARLYSNAEKLNEGKKFINEWTDFKGLCDSLQLKVDDVFRLYSHIIRGEQSITVSEKNLRDFFISESFSPFSYASYQKIMTDLFRILEILEYINLQMVKPTETGAWLQILDAYTNQYPKYAIVNYLYVYDWTKEENKKFVAFLKSLVRYIYYQGSTTTIKFEIYNIIKQVSQKININSYSKPDVSADFFSSLGRIKKGYALLAHYLLEPCAIPSYTIDKLIDSKDFTIVECQWEKDYDFIANSLGNLVVLDIPKKNQSWDKKAEYYKSSNIESVRNILNEGPLNYEQFHKRDADLKNILCEFFKGAKL